MLLLNVGTDERWDSEKNQFIEACPVELKLEHSLLSISKWESIWKVPFLHTTDNKGNDTKTTEQNISYIKCMTCNQKVPEEVYSYIGKKELKIVNDYINTEQTATWFSEYDTKSTQSGKKQIVTSELIYYWMVANQIPWEAQKWHLSRLYTLIQICSIKNQPAKKMSKTEIMNRNASLNAARKAAAQSKG